VMPFRRGHYLLEPVNIPRPPEKALLSTNRYYRGTWHRTLEVSRCNGVKHVGTSCDSVQQAEDARNDRRHSILPVNRDHQGTWNLEDNLMAVEIGREDSERATLSGWNC